MTQSFSVSYEIITQESAEHGDAEERGSISRGVSLREAITDLFETRTSQCSGLYSLEDNGRWLTAYNGMEFVTGAYENRALHLPDHTTQSSRDRVAALVLSI